MASSADTTIACTVGPTVRVDGAGDGKIRVTTNNSQVVTRGYYEEASRAKIFSLHTAVTGATVAAGHVSPPAAAAATTLTLSNPVGSGVNLKIIKGLLAHVTGTSGVGAWSWCGAAATGTLVITATVNAVAANQKLDGAASVAVGYTATALTAGPLHILKRHFPNAVFATAMDAATQNKVAEDLVDGQLVVPPGYIISLCPPSTGTTHVVAASIIYEEVAIPT